ncbi:uncharacterized protein LOC108205815 isoform X2 [Daucus carota subsp. sativus]|uniref:J domain-containing protein n=2 Tax=Daucus carota subsp. sativus TaxID=79200 RepID=A0A166EC89_DAUCS|nr:PREDICTED: uncharacterized protein LOC108205815 isoform X2 [Daucus carota subsp. sativus]
MNGKGKTLRACQKKGKSSNVVVIDIDSDNCGDDIFVDAPEYLPGSSSNGVRRDGKGSLESVICIDDEDDDENTGSNNLDKGRYVQNNTPVKLSKCKRTYSGPSASNRYGWTTDTESVSSDDDDDCDSDLEFEGSSGKLKRDWEKAFMRRQNESFGGVDQAGTSFVYDSHQDNGAGEYTVRYSDGSESTNYTSHEEGDRSPSIPMDNGKSESIFCKNTGETSTLNRADNVCNDESFASDHYGTSHLFTDNQHTGIDMDNKKDGSLPEINDVGNGQSFMDESNGSVFFNREMLKETDEYRRSVQEELEARQRELQIQAEEAQRLKRLEKRKKAAAMRLLDMEKRQKLRVEEIRNTQKKDEENLNLKEQIRTRVRKDLDRLEAACHDMESILRGLGINVNGVNGVHVAFKRALLTFHPDRASQSDIRKQVEAEEKFKLVTRMKEKYLSTLTCKPPA